MDIAAFAKWGVERKLKLRPGISKSFEMQAALPVWDRHRSNAIYQSFHSKATKLQLHIQLEFQRKLRCLSNERKISQRYIGYR